MRIINSSVNDIGASALSSAVVVVVYVGALLAVRDATETPRGAVLLGKAEDLGETVLLNVLDLRPTVLVSNPLFFFLELQSLLTSGWSRK